MCIRKFVLTILILPLGLSLAQKTTPVYLDDSKPLSNVVRAARELKSFQKVFLQPGESKVVTLTFAANDLAFFDSQFKLFAQPKQWSGFASAKPNQGCLFLRLKSK
jgi:hypothetical protein